MVSLNKANKQPVWRNARGEIACSRDKCTGDDCCKDCPIELKTQALMLHAAGQIRKAIELCEKAVSVAPDFAEGWNNLAAMYGMIKDYSKAKNAYEKAYQINHSSGNLRGLILSNRDLGDIQAALRYCEEYRKCFHDNTMDQVYKDLLATAATPRKQVSTSTILVQLLESARANNVLKSKPNTLPEIPEVAVMAEPTIRSLLSDITLSSESDPQKTLLLVAGYAGIAAVYLWHTDWPKLEKTGLYDLLPMQGGIGKLPDNISNMTQRPSGSTNAVILRNILDARVKSCMDLISRNVPHEKAESELLINYYKAMFLFAMVYQMQIYGMGVEPPKPIPQTESVFKAPIKKTESSPEEKLNEWKKLYPVKIDTAYQVFADTTNMTAPPYCINCLKKTSGSDEFGNAHVRLPLCEDCNNAQTGAVIEYIKTTLKQNSAARRKLIIASVIALFFMLTVFAVFYASLTNKTLAFIASGLTGMSLYGLLSLMRIPVAAPADLGAVPFYAKTESAMFNKTELIFRNGAYAHLFSETNKAEVKEISTPPAPTGRRVCVARYIKFSWIPYLVILAMLGGLAYAHYAVPDIMNDTVLQIIEYVPVPKELKSAVEERINSLSNALIGNRTLSDIGAVLPFATDAPKTVSPVEITQYTQISTQSGREEIKTMQARLKELGYAVGTIDGIWGKRTEEALKQFADNNGIYNLVTAEDPESEHILGRLGGTKEEVAYTALNAEAQWILYSDFAIGADNDRPIPYLGDNSIMSYQIVNGELIATFRVYARGSNTNTIKHVGLTAYTVTTSNEKQVPVSFNLNEKINSAGTCTESVTLPSASKIASVFCAITSVTYTDGKTICFDLQQNGYREWVLREPASTVAPTQALPTATSMPDPLSTTNGQIIVKPDYKCLCPFEVKAPTGGDTYVYLEYVDSCSSKVPRKLRSGSEKPYEEDIAFIVKSGKSVEIKVPIGKYKLYFATGDTFYGREYKFGTSGCYSESDELFEFYATDDSYMGATVTLYKVENGNLDTDMIPEDSFPD